MPGACRVLPSTRASDAAISDYQADPWRRGRDHPLIDDNLRFAARSLELVQLRLVPDGHTSSVRLVAVTIIKRIQGRARQSGYREQRSPRVPEARCGLPVDVGHGRHQRGRLDGLEIA